MGWLEKFKNDGFAVIEGFLSDKLCNDLRARSSALIDGLDMKTHPKSVFSTEHQQNDEYFMESQDKIRFFFEEGVFTEKGELNRPKNRAVNKMGHDIGTHLTAKYEAVSLTVYTMGLGLHVCEEIYKEATYSEKSQEVAKMLGFEEPVVVQSMVIFKQPEIGGRVTPHQDGTFLINNPPKVAGVWIALEDADCENGCLSFIPGSQNTEITRYMIRNPKPEGPVTIFTENSGNSIEYDYDMAKFVNVPVKKGTAIIIHSQVVHKSEKNTSSRSREIYTYHIAESKNTEWSSQNWLQPTDTYHFPPLYTTQR